MFRWLLLATGAGLFLFAVLKAWRLGITWDEAYSYLEFVDTGRMYPGAGGGMAANNHLLNTWLTALFVWLLGPSEFVLRLPNLFFFIVYLVFAGRFALGCRSRVLGFAGFLLLAANPYLADFFCLSRGYGISFGLLAGSVYWLGRYTTDAKRNQMNRCILFALFAMTANIALLHYVVAVFAFIAVTPRLAGRIADKPSDDTPWPALRGNPRWLNAAFGIFLAGFTLYGLVLQRYGALFYGGENGFMQDTLTTVLQRSLYGRQYAWFDPNVAAWGSVIFVCAAGSYVAWAAIYKRAFTMYPAALVVILLACASLAVIQHQVLGSLYMTERSALWIYIVFVFFLVSLADALQRYAGWIRIIPVVAACLLVVHFFRTASLNYVLEWKRDADVREIIADIRTEAESKYPGKLPVKVGAGLEFEQPFNYYIYRDRLTWLQPLQRQDRFLTGMDFYVLDDSEIKTEPFASMHRIARYPVSGASLLAPLHPARRLHRSE